MTWARHCDGPGCDTWQRGETPKGWLDVRETGVGIHHFHTWDCAMRFASGIEPTTVVGFGRTP